MSRYALNYHDEWKRAELCNDLDFTHDLIVKAMQDLDVYLTPLVIWGAPPQTFTGRGKGSGKRGRAGDSLGLTLRPGRKSMTAKLL